MSKELEVLEVGGIREGKEFYPFGAKVQLDDRTAKRWLKAGWARDVQTGEQYPRCTERVFLNVHS